MNRAYSAFNIFCVTNLKIHYHLADLSFCWAICITKPNEYIIYTRMLQEKFRTMKIVHYAMKIVITIKVVFKAEHPKIKRCNQVFINFENSLYFWCMWRKQKMVQENSKNWGHQFFYRLEWHTFWTEWFDEFYAKWDTLLFNLFL